jgi:hypothetical protein
MTAEEDYRRAVTTNLPDDHETKKVRPIRIPRYEKLIYISMVLVVALNFLVVALERGWL